MKVNKLKVDEEASINGIWVPWIEGVKLKIARALNDKHVEKAKEFIAPYRDIMNNGGQIPAKEQEEIALKCLAGTVLLDWEGLECDDGKSIPFSEDKAVELLREIPDMRTFVDAMSISANNFRRKGLEKAAKN